MFSLPIERMGVTGCSIARDCLPGRSWSPFAVVWPLKWYPRMPLRHSILAGNSLVSHAFVLRVFDAVRDTIVAVVLGGELAVPCTRNPLQRD